LLSPPLLPSNAITVAASVADAVPPPVTVTFTVTITITIIITVAITVAVPVAVAVTLAFASTVTIATDAANIFTAVIVACQHCCHHRNKCHTITLASSVAAYIALLLFSSMPLPSIQSLPMLPSSTMPLH
jgi:hypothetical protein